jgi:hypothetical protein
MKIFEHRKLKWIEINGKEFYLLQAFQADKWGNGDPVFLQVYGKVPLRVEDLPDKKWCILKSRIPAKNKKGEKEYVYTAFDRDHFDYDTPLIERKCPTTVFVGMGKRGSAYLAISSLARALDLEPQERRVKWLTGKVAEGTFTIDNLEPEKDSGNAGNTAYRFHHGPGERLHITRSYWEELLGLNRDRKKGAENGL